MGLATFFQDKGLSIHTVFNSWFVERGPLPRHTLAALSAILLDRSPHKLPSQLPVLLQLLIGLRRVFRLYCDLAPENLLHFLITTLFWLGPEIYNWLNLRFFLRLWLLAPN